MASRRTQIRQLFQSVPAAELSGATLDVLHARCEANLAAIDVWAKQGNQHSVRKAGTGLVALCAWLAARTLADDAHPDAFQRASGLSPKQFAQSERELSPVIQRIRASQISALSTPTKNDGRSDPGNAGTPSQAIKLSGNNISNNKDSNDNNNNISSSSVAFEAVARWANNIKSGVSPDKHASPRAAIGPSTPFSARVIGSNPVTGTEASSPATPSRSGLRDRTLIRSKPTFDPSPVQTPTKASSRRSSNREEDQTPTRMRVGNRSTALESPTVVAARDAPTSANGTPIRRIGVTPHTGRREYPVTLGFHYMDGDAAFDSNAARKRIKHCLDLLQSSNRSDPWQQDVGSLETVEW